MSTNDFYGSDMALEQDSNPTQINSNIDLKKEEIYQLRKRIYELDKEYQKKQRLRNLFMYAIHVICTFIVLILIVRALSFPSCLKWILPSLLWGGITFIFNTSLFSWFFAHNREENQHIAELDKRLSELCRK